MPDSHIHLHHGDLPDSVQFENSVAIDTEAMGLNPHRDRLCLIQLSAGDGICHLVQVNNSAVIHAPNLARLISDVEILKIFHFARFDLAILQHNLKVTAKSIYCTKVASKLIRNYTQRHGLKDLCRELLSVDISKEQQSSNWGQQHLTKEQLTYAASDVLHLHRLKEQLDIVLQRENRVQLAQSLFDFLPACATLDLLGYPELEVLAH